MLPITPLTAAGGKAIENGDAAAGANVGERGTYTVDEHLLSPQEVAERYGTSVDWASIPASPGLTTAQVRAVGGRVGG